MAIITSSEYLALPRRVIEFRLAPTSPSGHPFAGYGKPLLVLIRRSGMSMIQMMTEMTERLQNNKRSLYYARLWQKLLGT